MRLFIIIITTAMLFIASIAAAAPVKGNGAAKGEVFSNDDIAIPLASEYIQDGLVAMWDGIENVGLGSHDFNATKWIDLVDGKILPTTSSTVYCKKDCLYRYGTWVVGGSASSPIDATYDGEWTIETVVSLEGISYLNQARPFISFSNYTIRVPNITVTGTAQVWLSNIGGWSVATAPFGRMAFTLVRNGNVYYIYVNGELTYVKTDKNNLDWNPTNCIISQNHLSDADGNQSTSDNCAIRVYNRALSEEEVQLNFALDALRFNIED